MLKNKIIVKEKTLQEDMYYKDHLVLKYVINYPQFTSNDFETLLMKLNGYYKTKAYMYLKTNVMNLYQMSMVEYEYSVANEYPIRTYEAYVNYEVTYNQNCTLSLYFDQYEYAGGAHGLTVRTSDTWELDKSKRMELCELFPGRKCKEHIIKQINTMIAEEFAKGNQVYFDDYSQLVEKAYKGNQFYLTPEGVVIYYQHYDIAPYSTGIPTFTLPYSPSGPIEPKC